MDSNVSHVDRRLQLQFWSGNRRGHGLRIDGVRLRRTRADEDERDRVPTRIAAFQMDGAVWGMGCHQVVLMSGEPMMVHRVIVIRVVVDVQYRDMPQPGDQGQSEQDCSQATHKASV